MKISDLHLVPIGTHVQRIVAVCESVPDDEVIGKAEILAATCINAACYNNICNDHRLQPYKVTRRGPIGNLWGKPKTIAKLKKLQANL